MSIVVRIDGAREFDNEFPFYIEFCDVRRKVPPLKKRENEHKETKALFHESVGCQTRAPYTPVKFYSQLSCLFFLQIFAERSIENKTTKFFAS
jgi:hypothetical protein